MPKGLSKWIIGIAIGIAVLFFVGQVESLATPLRTFFDLLVPAAG